MQVSKKFLASILACALVGCANQGGITKQQVGTVAGGVVGGIIGNEVFHGGGKTAGIIGGTIVGAMLGSAIGQSMDQQDQMHAQQALTTVPMGQEAAWTNERTGTEYTVRPINEYSSNGSYCRRAKITINVEGKRDTAYTTVCRRNGKWYTQS
jgi:surface antigen